MRTLLKGAEVYTDGGFVRRDISICDGKISFDITGAFDVSENIEGFVVIPGFADVHVHLREPGFSYKETIRTGTMAAARGGYSAVCAMPNLKPVPSTRESLSQEIDIIERDAVVRVYPYGAITMDQSGRGELSDMEEMADNVIAFSDDGKGVQTAELMEEAMKRAAKLGKLIVAHCEDESELKKGGCIHDGRFAREHGYIGINSASEWKQVKRDIELAERTGASYHVCHVSTKESVELIREAKKRGVKVTCETGPHYLIYTDEDLKEDGSWKMNPPIREAADRDALLRGINDGTVDCIITDHAPHSEEEKSKGLAGSAFGIVGLETAFPVVYSRLVKTGEISLQKMVELMSINPRKIFGIPGGSIADGEPADICVLDLNKEYDIDSSTFFSMGKSTLFDGQRVWGEVVMNFVKGEKVFDRERDLPEK